MRQGQQLEQPFLATQTQTLRWWQQQQQIPFQVKVYRKDGMARASSCVRRLLNLQNHTFSVFAPFRNFGGGAMFVFTIIALSINKQPQLWSRNMKISVMAGAAVWGLLGAIPAYKILAKANSDLMARVVTRQPYRVVISEDLVAQRTMKSWVKLAIALLFTAAGMGAGRLMTRKVAGYLTVALLSGGLSAGLAFERSRWLTRKAIYLALATATSTALGDFAKISATKLHAIFSNKPMSPAFRAALWFTVACTVWVNIPNFINKMSKNLRKFREVWNQKTIVPFREQQLRALAQAYYSVDRPMRTLRFSNFNTAKQFLKAAVFTEETSTRSLLLKKNYQYKLPLWIFAINVAIFSSYVYPYFESGENAGRDFFGDGNERVVAVYGLLSVLAYFCMEFYLSVELVGQVKTVTAMPKTRAVVESSPGEVVDNTPALCITRGTLAQAIGFAMIAATPPLFYLINARGSSMSNNVGAAVLTGWLIFCTIYAQVLSKTAPTILRSLNRVPLDNPAAHYINSLLGFYQQRELAAERKLQRQPNTAVPKPSKISRFSSDSPATLAAKIESAISDLDDYLQGRAVPMRPVV